MPSDSRWIKVPTSIKLRDMVSRKESGEIYPFFAWLQGVPLMDARFSVDWKTNRSAMIIADAFFDKKPGTWVRLSLSDYELLKEAVEEPTFIHVATRAIVKGYANPAIFQQIGPYIEAVQSAEDEMPKEAVEQLPPSA